MTIQKQFPTYQSHLPDSYVVTETLPAFDLSDFLRVLRTRKLTIAGTAILVIVITALAISRLTPLYTATAYVMLDQRQNNVISANAVISGLPTDSASIENQVQILRSRSLAARVVDELNLTADADFNPALAPKPDDWTTDLMAWLRPDRWFVAEEAVPPPAVEPADPRNAAINRLLANLTAVPAGRSTTIAIGFESKSAEKSALIANTVAEAYVEDQLQAKFEATEKASQWLSERLQQLSTQTQSSERMVEQYKVENRLTDAATPGIAPGTTIVQQQLSALNLQLISAQADLAQQEAKYQQVMAMQQAGQAADLSQVVASPLISQLRQQEADILRQEAELSTRYGPRHPKLLDLQSEKQNLSAKIDEEVRRVVEGVAGDVRVARARVVSLQDSLTRITSQTQAENLARVKLSELTASATSNRAVYDAFLGRFKEIEGQEAVEVPDARIISRAMPPSSPSFPKKTLFLGAAIPGGLMLGLVLAMISHSLESGFRTREQVEQALSLPVLAILPEIGHFARTWNGPADCVVKSPTSAFAEAVRGLQLGLALSNGDKPPKTVVVASSVPSEGKTTAAVSLARLASRGGQRVILIDADLRQPKVASTIGKLQPEYGIADVLAGKIALENCLVKDPISDAMILPAVRNIANPSDLIASDGMSQVISKLASWCDLLIIDSPPLLPVNDARILARLADAVVFVVRWEKTPAAAARNAVRLLTDIMAPVAGIVLARTNKEQFYYDNYGRDTHRNFRKYYRS